MSRISYVNGKYTRKRNASILLDDRALLFSDGVYEVIAVSDANLIEWDRHLNRLYRSLNSLEIKLPMEFSPLRFDS